MADTFADLRQKAAATALGEIADTGVPAAPGGVPVSPALPGPGLRTTALQNPSGRIAGLFQEAGVNVSQDELDALLKLPSDQFGEALILRMQRKGGEDIPALAGPGSVGDPEINILRESTAQLALLPEVMPGGFTVDPQDATIIIGPNGRRFQEIME